jgi:hypothetical protein
MRHYGSEDAFTCSVDEFSGRMFLPGTLLPINYIARTLFPMGVVDVSGDVFTRNHCRQGRSLRYAAA